MADSTVFAYPIRVGSPGDRGAATACLGQPGPPVAHNDLQEKEATLRNQGNPRQPTPAGAHPYRVETDITNLTKW